MKTLIQICFLFILFTQVWLFAQVTTPPSAGDGSAGNPYQIATKENLNWISYQVNTIHNTFEGKYLIQTDTIDASGVNFLRIGNEQYEFKGTYDGGGNFITGLYISSAADGCVGFFGSTWAATIRNLGLVGVNIHGKNNMGGLVGSARGGTTISNCYCTGYVGVTHSSGFMYIGGLVGYNSSSSIVNCYSATTVDVPGVQYAGGLVGSNSSGTITNCYSTGNVLYGAADIAGLIGDNYHGTITNCFWDTQTSGRSSSDGGTGLTSVQMTTPSTFAAWDFTTPVWKMDGYNNGGYPYLNWQVVNPPAAPAAQATNVIFSSITTTDMTISWTNGNGFRKAVFVFEGSSGTASPVNNTTYTGNAAFRSGTQIGSSGWYCVYNGAGSSVTVTGLTEGNPYVAQVFEYNGLPGNEKYLVTTAAGNPSSLSALPVELTSFTANRVDSGILLKWETASEIDNYGFEVERSVGSRQNTVGNEDHLNWEKIGFVEANGNSNSPKHYSLVDNNNPPTGNLKYRLKQIDTDGNYKYYPTIAEVNFKLTDVKENPLPEEFSLSQNYPNPFNPTTSIRFSIPDNPLLRGVGGVLTSLKVYDILGSEVSTLVNEHKAPGYYEVEFNANNLSSGIYIYKLTAGSFSAVRKLSILK